MRDQTQFCKKCSIITCSRCHDCGEFQGALKDEINRETRTNHNDDEDEQGNPINV